MDDTLAGLLQVALLLVLLAACYVPLGDYLATAFTDRRDWRVEAALYRLVRVDPAAGQRWPTYAAGVLGFSFVSVVVLYLLQRLQPLLPMSFGRGAVEPAVAFNTVISFVTNTNWQSYVPEQTLGNTVQMAGLTVQNVLSAAVGLAVAAALVRGFVRSGTDRIGNFWVDLTRATVRVMLPLALVGAVLLLATGVTMSLRSATATGIPLAPTASQEAVKMLGTNGGGIFNANSAHPFENPNALSNLLQVFLMLVVPVAMTRAFGTMLREGATTPAQARSARRQGTVLLAVMAALWGALLAVAWVAETHPNGAAGIATGALEGKETRFGIPTSVLFGVSTTGTSTGAVNAMHDSLTGGAGGVTLLNMLLGEVAPGGVGVGLVGLLLVAVVAMFLAGLMVGRTPEYLGKKLGRREVTFAAVYILVMPALVLLGTGLTLALPGTPALLANSGAHGLSEVLYAFASAANNNGSAFAGLTATGDYLQSALGLAMLFGRFLLILAVLGLAGSLAQQRRVPATAGTLATDTPLFGVLVGGTLVLVAALTFFPALALGPLAEALT